MTPYGIEPATFRFVTQHLNHCATAVPNRNEYQEYFLGCKGGRCVGLATCHLHVLIVLKYGSLNLLEPSAPVQTCNGIALLYPSQT